jgi:hypothetical protein
LVSEDADSIDGKLDLRAFGWGRAGRIHHPLDYAQGQRQEGGNESMGWIASILSPHVYFARGEVKSSVGEFTAKGAKERESLGFFSASSNSIRETVGYRSVCEAISSSWWSLRISKCVEKSKAYLPAFYTLRLHTKVLTKNETAAKPFDVSFVPTTWRKKEVTND